MQIKFTRKKGGQVDTLLKNLKPLNHSTLGVGHFEEQGDHSTAEMSYVELMGYWASGEDGIVRDPLMALHRIMVEKKGFETNPDIDNTMTTMLSKAPNSAVAEETHDRVGKVLRDEYYSIFGVVGPFMPPDADGTPMVETSELADEASYKSSLNNTIKK